MTDKKTAPRRCNLPTPLQNQPVLSRDQAVAMERIFKVLANATRLRILHMLVRAPDTAVGVLANSIGMQPQAVSNQLRRLMDRGIVAARRDGNSIRYRIVDACTIDLLAQGFCLAFYDQETAASFSQVATANQNSPLT